MAPSFLREVRLHAARPWCSLTGIRQSCVGVSVSAAPDAWAVLERGFGVGSVAPSPGAVAVGRHGPGIILLPGLRLCAAVALEAIPLAALVAALRAVDLGCLESREFVPESRTPKSAGISTQILGFAQTVHS